MDDKTMDNDQHTDQAGTTADMMDDEEEMRKVVKTMLGEWVLSSHRYGR